MFLRFSSRRLALFGLGILCTTTIIMILFYGGPESFLSKRPEPEWLPQKKYVTEHDTSGKGKKYSYSKDMPLIFVGGMPRSGTTLLRVMLDSHPDIRCGEETRVIPRLLNLRNGWVKAPIESKRLQEAGISPEVLDAAVSAFILEIIVKHGKPANRLCNKDPFTLKAAVYLHGLYPNSKFLFLIRDGRAVAHSIVSRGVTISGFNHQDYRECLMKWNSAIKVMHDECQKLTESVCLPVHYEQLVLHPETMMRRILNFLDLPWNETTLHHETLVNEPNGIRLSKLERSTDQVIKPINTEALSKWVGAMPKDVVRDMSIIAPMLSVLGYDPYANPPNYGDPDTFVKQKMKEIESNKLDWSIKEQQLISERENLRNQLTLKSGPQPQTPESTTNKTH